MIAFGACLSTLLASVLYRTRSAASVAWEFLERWGLNPAEADFAESVARMPKMASSLTRYPARVTTLSFLALILLGTLLLVMPFCSVAGRPPISFLDALFTSTSAVCVTGLSVRSTIDDFSVIGQIVILFLIQLGGIGIMTITTLLVLLLGGRSGLRHQAVIAETLGAGGKTDVRTILRSVILTAGTIELIGVVLLWIRFSFDMHWLRALWYAMFHAVSAFCNAGFALWNDSLIAYQDDWVVNGVICGLIVLGGLGFPVLLDAWGKMCWRKPWAWESLQLHSKITLLGTVFLVVFGYVTFTILEWDNALAEASWSGKILIPMFQSVTCRTAGFNSIDLNDLTNASLFVSILLMAIGGSTCSTAGGIKVSTIALLVMHATRRFQGYTSVSYFRRTIPQASVERAMASTLVFFTAAITACLLLMMIEQSGQSHGSHQDSFLDAMFEVTSALATVGLSTGITPSLSAPGKIVIVLLMFLGRLGPVSVMAALSRTRRPPKIEYASEELLLG